MIYVKLKYVYKHGELKFKVSKSIKEKYKSLVEKSDDNTVGDWCHYDHDKDEVIITSVEYPKNDLKNITHVYLVDCNDSGGGGSYLCDSTYHLFLTKKEMLKFVKHSIWEDLSYNEYDYESDENGHKDDKIKIESIKLFEEFINNKVVEFEGSDTNTISYIKKRILN